MWRFIFILALYSGGLGAATQPRRLRSSICEKDLALIAERVSSRLTVSPVPERPVYSGKETYNAFLLSENPWKTWQDQTLSGHKPIGETYAELSPAEKSVFEKEFRKRHQKNWILEKDGEFLASSIQHFLGAEEVLANGLWQEARRLRRELGDSPSPQALQNVDYAEARAKAIFKDLVARHLEIIQGKSNYVGRMPEKNRRQISGALSSLAATYLTAQGVEFTKTNSPDHRDTLAFEVSPDGDNPLAAQLRELRKRVAPDYKLFIVPSLFATESKNGLITKDHFLLSSADFYNLAFPPHTLESIKNHLALEAQVVRTVGSPLDFSFTPTGQKGGNLGGPHLFSRLVRMKNSALAVQREEDPQARDVGLISLMHEAMTYSQENESWRNHSALWAGRLTSAAMYFAKSETKFSPENFKGQAFFRVPGWGEEGFGILLQHFKGVDNLILVSREGLLNFPVNEKNTEMRRLVDLWPSLNTMESSERNDVLWDLVSQLKRKVEVSNRFALEADNLIPDYDKELKDFSFEGLGAWARQVGEIRIPTVTRNTLRTHGDKSPRNVLLDALGLDPIVPKASSPVLLQSPLETPRPLTHHKKAFLGSQTSSERDYWADKIAMTTVAKFADSRNWGWQDVSKDGVGYDLELANRLTGEVLKVEVKAKPSESDSLRMYRTEVDTFSRNPEGSLLAIVWIDAEGKTRMELRQPKISSPPDDEEDLRTYSLKKVLKATPALTLPLLKE